MQEEFNPKNIILAIDIGSSKIHTLVAEIISNTPRVIGWGVCESQGVQKGIVTNIEQVSANLGQAVRDATNMAGVKVKKAIISISGAYAEYTPASAVANIPERGEIQFNDIERLMQSCVYNAALKREYVPIHVLPYKFSVRDYNVPIEDPLFMNAESLECHAYIVMAKKSVVQNLKKVLTKCEIEVEDIVLSSYASSIATLTAEERRQGVVCIDMGAQTCDMMIYSGASMCYGNYFPVGSAHITSDIARVLGISRELAEKLKVEYVDMIVQEGDDKKGLNVPYRDEPIPVLTLHKITEARVRETLEVLGDIIERSGMRDYVGGGVVLTGGMTKLKGLEQYLHQESAMHPLPVKIATPMGVDGAFEILKDPEMATAVGLVLYAAGHFTNYELTMQNTIKMRKSHGVQKTMQHTSSYGTFQEGNVQDLQIKKQVLPPRVKQKTQNTDVEANSIEAKGENPFRRFWRWLSQLF
ncbi:cell division protein FtsA [uncultured Helicobacter sp.]|uniref:cell division protein FtsA n=1 Tax=uncultured Helicobacter sp. TaxID=175537 RepID=UPI00374F6FA5